MKAVISRSLLWIVPKWPFPAEDGARIATSTLLSHLHDTGEVTVDLLAIVPFGERINELEAKVRLGVRHVYIVRRAAPQGLSNFLLRLVRMIFSPRTPMTLASFSTPRIRAEIREILNSGEKGVGWEALVYDGLHGAAHAIHHGEFQNPMRSRVVYRAHNRESDLWFRAAKSSLSRIKRIFLGWQGRLVRRFEDSLVANALTFPVSDNDLAAFRAAVPNTAMQTVPIGLTFTEPAPYPTGSRTQLLFIGRLDWPPNRDGLHWFLTEVWPQVLTEREDIDLVIAGSGEGEWLRPLSNGVRTLFLGKVDSVDRLYTDSAAAIVPVFYGSGTRVKAIEASRFGRVCISTSLGVEGTGLSEGHSFIRAETAKEWIDALVSLNPEKAREMGRSAFLNSKSAFDAGDAAKTFADAVGAA